MSVQSDVAKPTVGAEFKRGWTIIIVAAIGMACGLSAIPIYSMGTFTKPLTEAFGFERAQANGIYTAFTIGNLVAAPILGLLIDRYGVRKVGIFSVIGTALGYAAMGLIANSLWGFYIIAFLTAVFGVGTVPITWSRVVVDWFNVGRGRALGLALAGTGISAILIPSYTTWLMGEWGWQAGFIGLALLPGLIALPAVYFLLYDRNEKHAAPLVKDVVAEAAEIQIDFKTALKGHRFWALNVVFFLIGICIAGLIANLVPMLTDRGIETKTAAQIAGIIGVAVIVGRIATGYLVDRFWAPAVGLVLLSIPAISCLILALGIGGTTGAIIAAVLIGLAAGAEFDLMSYLVSQYFGQRRYGIIYACIYAVFKISAGVGTSLFGFAFDETGSYNTILYLAVGCFIGSSLLLLSLGRYPSSTRTH